MFVINVMECIHTKTGFLFLLSLKELGFSCLQLCRDHVASDHMSDLKMYGVFA